MPRKRLVLAGAILIACILPAVASLRWKAWAIEWNRREFARLENAAREEHEAKLASNNTFSDDHGSASSPAVPTSFPESTMLQLTNRLLGWPGSDYFKSSLTDRASFHRQLLVDLGYLQSATYRVGGWAARGGLHAALEGSSLVGPDKPPECDAYHVGDEDLDVLYRTVLRTEERDPKPPFTYGELTVIDKPDRIRLWAEFIERENQSDAEWIIHIERERALIENVVPFCLLLPAHLTCVDVALHECYEAWRLVFWECRYRFQPSPSARLCSEVKRQIRRISCGLDLGF